MDLNLKSNPELPLYERLTRQLREKVEAGVLQPGDRLPSFTEMRAQHGIHKATAERAHMILEQDGLVVREKGRGVFVAQKKPAQKRTIKGVIGFSGIEFMREGNSPYWSRVLAGVQEVLRERSFELLFLNENAPRVSEKVDGVLLNAMIEWANPLWHDEKFPCVALFIPDRKTEISSVVADDYAGAREATQHLLDLGHRKIAVLHSLTDKYLLPRRLAGYRDALNGAGIAAQSQWTRPVSDVTNVDFRLTAYESMKAWLKADWQKLGCTALLAQNDETAIGAMEALHAAGLKVPRDVSVIGFDNTQRCEYSRPRLTSVEVPLYEMGKSATKLLLHHIENGVGQWEHRTLPTRLQIRDSTAPGI
jgi:DNA-binding LacI/PurR family transcriptional regulator